MKLLIRLSLFILVLCRTGLAGAATQVPEPPAIEAKSFVLFDFASGQVLAEKDSHARVEPASITKIMTAYVVFDELRSGHVKLEDEVLISEKAWRTQGSRTFVEVGKRVKFQDLLHGVIVQSGNDATIALAEHIAGDESVFAQLMNRHAERLGMKDSHFTNATGLPDPALYTTAHDVALLSQALIRDFPQQYPLFKAREFTFGHRGDIKQQNRNMLLDLDPSADGIKTGHTENAGYCLAASSIREGRRLIAVVMGTRGPRQRAQASKALLDFGFRFYDTVQMFGPAKPVSTVRAWKGAETQLPVGTAEPIALAVPRGAGNQLQIDPKVSAAQLVAPIREGQPIGTLTISLEGKVIRTEPIVALKTIPEGSLWQRAIDTLKLWIES